MGPFVTLWLLIAFLVPERAQAQPQVAMNCARTPAGCNNMCYAIGCLGRPGVLTKGNNAELNRRRSGCKTAPCADPGFLFNAGGNTCDEFPFANAVQGGWGAVQRCIPRVESDRQGGQIRAFFRGTGIAVGQNYGVWVQLVNPALSPFCAGALCAPDNQEFITNRFAVRGAASQTPIDMYRPATTTGPTGNATQFRKFKTDDGREVLLMDTTSKDSWIGKKIFIDEGVNATIVAEIKK